MRFNFEDFKNKYLGEYLRQVVVDKRCVNASVFTYAKGLQDLYPNLKNAKRDGLGREEFGLSQVNSYDIPHTIKNYTRFGKRVMVDICGDSIVAVPEYNFEQYLSRRITTNVVLVPVSGSTELFVAILPGAKIGNHILLGGQKKSAENGLYACTASGVFRKLPADYRQKLGERVLSEGELVVLAHQTDSLTNGVYQVQSGVLTKLAINLLNLTMDGISMKEGNLLLLNTCAFARQNDVYEIKNGLLYRKEGVDYNYLSVGVKKGVIHKDKTYFLCRSELGTFPISGMGKEFLEGKDYILRNRFRYFFSTRFDFTDSVFHEGKLYFTGENGIILYLLDGQYHIIDTDFEVNLRRMKFYNGTGWLLGDEGLLARATGSATQWVSLGLETVDGFNDICFISEQIGVVVGDLAQVYVTLDGGKTFKLVDLFEETKLNLNRVEMQVISEAEQTYKALIFGENGQYVELFIINI